MTDDERAFRRAQREANTRIMRAALDILAADPRVEDFELESLTLVWPGGDWSGPVPEGDWVYVLGNRRGFRRHYLVKTATGQLWVLPIDEGYDADEVRRLTDEFDEAPVVDP